jgi:hypothetical protein
MQNWPSLNILHTFWRHFCQCRVRKWYFSIWILNESRRVHTSGLLFSVRFSQAFISHCGDSKIQWHVYSVLYHQWWHKYLWNPTLKGEQHFKWTFKVEMLSSFSSMACFLPTVPVTRRLLIPLYEMLRARDYFEHCVNVHHNSLLRMRSFIKEIRKNLHKSVRKICIQ